MASAAGHYSRETQHSLRTQPAAMLRSVWRPTYSFFYFFLTLIGRAAHNQRDSPGGSTRCAQRTFPSEYYVDGHTCLILWGKDIQIVNIPNHPQNERLRCTGWAKKVIPLVPYTYYIVREVSLFWPTLYTHLTQQRIKQVHYSPISLSTARKITWRAVLSVNTAWSLLITSFFPKQ